MANGKFTVIANDTPRPKAYKSGLDDRGIDSPAGPTPEEGLRLMHAFLRIRDPHQRAWLVAQAERLADVR
jgi:hypothetical protein